MSNYGYSGIESAEASTRYRKRRSFKVWLRDRLSMSINKDMPSTLSISKESSSNYPMENKFNKSFDGWSIRLHKAVGGHIVEAWKNEGDRMNAVSSSYRQPHELFMVRDDEDLGASINDILIQLMLRG